MLIVTRKAAHACGASGKGHAIHIGGLVTASLTTISGRKAMFRITDFQGNHSRTATVPVGKSLFIPTLDTTITPMRVLGSDSLKVGVDAPQHISIERDDMSQRGKVAA